MCLFRSVRVRVVFRCVCVWCLCAHFCVCVCVCISLCVCVWTCKRWLAQRNQGGSCVPEVYTLSTRGTRVAIIRSVCGVRVRCVCVCVRVCVRVFGRCVPRVVRSKTSARRRRRSCAPSRATEARTRRPRSHRTISRTCASGGSSAAGTAR